MLHHLNSDYKHFGQWILDLFIYFSIYLDLFFNVCIYLNKI